MSSEKEECPYCGKMYKNLNSHISRMHKGKKSKSKKDSTSRSEESLEAELKAKFLSKSSSDDVEMHDLEEKKSGKSKKKEKKKVKVEKPNWERKVVVDFWLTNLHDAEIGFYQKERFMAKNRQFSKNLELIGAVKEEGKAEGMFGYNKANWDDIEPKDLAKKRLVIKWFNSQSVAHLGTLEEMVISSMRSSIGADDFLPSFKLIIPRYKYIVDLNKEHTKLPKTGEIFTFALKDEKKDRWEIFSFDEKRFTIGSDWEILVGDDRVVGKIDEKKMNIGGKFEVYFYDESLYKFKPFYSTVILFTMMLKFKDEIRDKINQMREFLKEEKLELDISADEEKFLMNPRSIRR